MPCKFMPCQITALMNFLQISKFFSIMVFNHISYLSFYEPWARILSLTLCSDLIFFVMVYNNTNVLSLYHQDGWGVSVFEEKS